MRPGGPTARVLGAALKATPADRAPAAPKKPVNLLAETRPKPRADGMRDLLYRPDTDGPPQFAPALLRPGMVWEQGRWRPETPQERTAPKIVPVAQKAAAPRTNAVRVSRSLPNPLLDTPIEAEKVYRGLDFDVTGRGLLETFIRELPKGIDAGLLGATAFEQAAIAAKKGATSADLADTDTDAFRHALWNYKMAKAIGVEAAKRFADAYEISRPNRDSRRLMDLYNNEIGRRLAADKRNHNRPDTVVVMEALKAGKLRAKPFAVRTDLARPGARNTLYRHPVMRSFLGTMARTLRNVF